VATSAAGTCTSADYPLMTGALLANAPKATLTFSGAGRARGFILTSNTSGIGPVFIVDTDGAPVWSFPISGFATRAHMSWDGKQIYVVAAVSGAGDNGDVSRISMDGLDVEAKLSGLTGAHHDLTATPDGVAALMVDNTVVERSADGTLTTVAALATLYGRTGHPNSLHYYAWDDCYTIGDSGRRLYVKITRKGDLVWQFGGGEPTDPSKLFQGVPSWDISHGHQLLPDGTFAFFNNYYNGGLGGSAARVFKLDTTTMTATSVLTYQASGVMTTVLGDVQRLPNGNFLVNFSVGGQIREIDPSGQLVASYTLGANLGYAEFRESLYGPPPY
jgi:hypothetical protein